MTIVTTETRPRETAGAQGQVGTPEPARSLPVAALLSLSGGFLDAFTWLSLGGVFANSQTGNVVLLGMYAALGKWHDAAHHIPPIVAFFTGAWVATRLRAPRLCLVLEIVALLTVMLLPHGFSPTLAIIVISFGVAMQAVSFKHVERWNFLSVTVTGNLLRAIEEVTSTNDPEAARGARLLLVVCLMFLLGAVVGGFVTARLAETGLAVPAAILAIALGLCSRYR